jgi:MYXO-CTERM domain-containing protein
MKRIATLAALGLTAVGLLVPQNADASCDNDMDCTGGPARIMLILDASSAMLNEGNAPGTEGNTDWDRVRDVLTATGDSLYDAEVEPSGPVASQVVHFGMVVFGDDAPAPGEQKVVVSYAPCSEPNLRWALDPETSCEDPGCTDPWGGPPIDWTFKDGSEIDPPDFAIETLSHVPRCEGAGPGCDGSARFTHVGIELASDHQANYSVTPPYLEDDTTIYANILLTDGEYDSTDAEVQAALESAFDDGIVTYVVGFGSEAGTPQFGMQLADMADWGSGGAVTHYEALNMGELQNAVGSIIEDMDLPCCATIDCSDFGGADGGGGSDDGSAEWGSADGSGTADAGSDADADGPGAEEGIDDDGGCGCSTRSIPDPAGWGLLGLALIALRRRGR